jgi:hypothetical protein
MGAKGYYYTWQVLLSVWGSSCDDRNNKDECNDNSCRWIWFPFFLAP